MGFNKKYLNKKEIFDVFNKKGYLGIVEYIGNSDVLIGLDEQLNQVLDITFCNYCPTIKNIKIEKIIYGK
jgi:hypothetical protein